jgi:hypothetical protein
LKGRGACETYDSCPILSPLPSSLDQPEEVESSDLSQVSRSLADMFTRVLNSLCLVASQLGVVDREREGKGMRVEGSGV